MINKWEGIHLSSFMSLSGIDGLLDYQMGESADVEEIEFCLWLRRGKLNSVFLVHDKQLHYVVKYTEVSVLTWRNVPFAYCWYEFYISLVLTLWTDVNNVW